MVCSYTTISVTCDTPVVLSAYSNGQVIDPEHATVIYHGRNQKTERVPFCIQECLRPRSRRYISLQSLFSSSLSFYDLTMKATMRNGRCHPPLYHFWSAIALLTLIYFLTRHPPSLHLLVQNDYYTSNDKDNLRDFRKDASNSTLGVCLSLHVFQNLN